MNFFSKCKNSQEAKEIFRDLSKCFHPDKGGNAELMKELNSQYEKWESLANSSPSFKFNKVNQVDSEFGLDINYYKMRCETLERETYQIKHHLKRVSTENEIEKRNLHHARTRMFSLEQQIYDLEIKHKEEKKKLKMRLDKQKKPTKRLRKIINV